MLKAPKPANEDARLRDLYSFEILDSENEKDYDGLVELVSQVCQCPIAIVNFLDSNRQWYKAAKNLTNKEANRDDSFCGHAIMNNEVFIVADATKDDRFFDNPDVKGGLKVRFYAGAPIVSPNGYNLGTVCAIDSVPKFISSEQVTALKTVAEQVSRLLELRKNNKQILETAKSMVTEQKKIAQMNMSETESQNYQTAYILHEEINQSVAAIRSYVDKARNEETLSKDYLDASIDELDRLANHITRLSGKLNPVVLTNENYQTVIEKLVRDIERRERFDVKLVFKGQPGIFRKEKGQMILRVIQDLFRFAIHSSSRNITMNITGNQGLDITFEYDTKKMMMENQKLLLQDNILNRVEILGGTMEKNRYDSGETRIHIVLPEVLTEVLTS